MTPRFQRVLVAYRGNPLHRRHGVATRAFEEIMLVGPESISNKTMSYL